MSCRVLGRGVEGFLMNRVVEHAQTLGLGQVTAEYIPTAKNGMVRDFFRQFGFEKTAEETNGATRWKLSTDEYLSWKTYMKKAEEE